MLSELGALISSGGHHDLVAVTVPVSGETDPSALVIGSRRARDRWSCWEQPDRGGFSLATLGQVRELVSRGDDRFRQIERDASEIISSIERFGNEDLPQGAGPVFTGGFSFAPDGCSTSEWSSLPPALLV
ncbi:MAG: hypothetical protein ACKOPI_06405 [bacterium]